MATVAPKKSSLPHSVFRLPAPETTEYPSTGRPNCGPPLLAGGQRLPYSESTPPTQYACLGWGACPGLLHTTGRWGLWWTVACKVYSSCYALEHWAPFLAADGVPCIAELCVGILLMKSLCFFSRVAIISLLACLVLSQIPSFSIVPSEDCRWRHQIPVLSVFLGSSP